MHKTRAKEIVDRLDAIEDELKALAGEMSSELDGASAWAIARAGMAAQIAQNATADAGNTIKAHFDLWTEDDRASMQAFSARMAALAGEPSHAG